MEMSNEWRNWCRLCGTENCTDIDVFIKDENFFSLSEAIQRFLSITISDTDEAPKKICTNCQTLLSMLMTFSIKASKVQEMYSELQFNDKFEMLTNFDVLREKYGIQIDEKLLAFIESEVNKDKNQQQQQQQQQQQISSEDDEPLSKRRRKRRSHRFKIKSEESDGSFNENDFTKVLQADQDDDDDAEEYYSDEKTELDDDLRTILDCVSVNVNSGEIKEENQFENTAKKSSSSSSSKGQRNRSKISNKKSSKDPKIFCEVCSKGFINQGGYKWHLKMAHQIVKNPETYPCQTCGKVYQKIAQLKVHENMHLPPEERKWYPCPHCEKKFTVESSVGNHIRTVHIKEKCFICEECGKSFVTNDALNSHKLVHTDYAPFQCPKCSKSFKRMPSLKNHLDSHEDTKYICPVCGLQLNTKTTLRRHMVIHSDEKKYKCNFCGNQFKRSKALKNHLILHTGLKPYECPFCEQTFANGSNCRKHQKNSHTVELAAMEDAGEKKICKNVPRLEHLKAVNNAALGGLDIEFNNQKIEKLDLQQVDGGSILQDLQQHQLQLQPLQQQQQLQSAVTTTVTTAATCHSI